MGAKGRAQRGERDRSLLPALKTKGPLHPDGTRATCSLEETSLADHETAGSTHILSGPHPHAWWVLAPGSSNVPREQPPRRAGLLPKQRGSCSVTAAA